MSNHAYNWRLKQTAKQHHKKSIYVTKRDSESIDSSHIFFCFHPLCILYFESSTRSHSCLFVLFKECIRYAFCVFFIFGWCSAFHSFTFWFWYNFHCILLLLIQSIFYYYIFLDGSKEKQKVFFFIVEVKCKLNYRQWNLKKKIEM